MERIVAHRGLTFTVPVGFSLVGGEVRTGDATVPGGVRVTITEEPRSAGEPLVAVARRKLDAIRAGKTHLDVVTDGPLVVGNERAHLVRLRYGLDTLPLGDIEQVFVVIDAREPDAVTSLSLLTLASSFSGQEETWKRLLASVRFDDEEPRLPRVRPHRASFELPDAWQEIVSWELGRRDLPAALVVRSEPRNLRQPFRKLVDERLATLKEAGSAVSENTPLPGVAGRSAHRIAFTSGAGSPLPIEEVAILVDGGDSLLTFGAESPANAGAFEEAERVLEGLLGTVRIVSQPRPAGAAAKKPLVAGASLGSLVLAGRQHAELHEELAGRGFVATRLPLAAPVTRTGERRFARIDGSATAKLDDPKLACEWVYLHEDGGLVRVFPHGHGSLGLGGAVPPSARMSIVTGGTKGTSLDDELACGPGGTRPRTLAAAHGLLFPTDPVREARAAAAYMRGTWAQLQRSPIPPPTAPLEDRVGLPLTRSVVFTRDFEDVVARVERLAANAVRREHGGQVAFFFAADGRVGFVASLVLGLGSHTFTLAPVGVPSSVDRLQRVLRQLMRGERYHVYDDATGEDVTATVMRLPSFLVGPTRRRPRLLEI